MSGKMGLGRGLSALLSEEAEPDTGGTSQLKRDTVPLASLEPNPHQPRREFDPEMLEDLSKSIAEKGVLQPILVRPLDGSVGRYQIIAGERRWRAAQKARLHDVPVIIREMTDSEALEVAIVENVQRSDLNAIEEGAGYRMLIDRFGYSQEQLAKIIGKSRSHIANSMRLMSLPDKVRDLVQEGKLSAGHARTLIGLAQAEALAREIVDKDLTVREAEQLAKQTKGGGAEEVGNRGGSGPAAKDADTLQLERDIAAAIRLRVAIADKGEKGGALTVKYKNLEELDRLCRILMRPGDD